MCSIYVAVYVTVLSFLQVSRKICDLYRKCCSGNKDSIQTFIATHSLPLPPSPPPPVTAPQTACGMKEGESSLMEEDDTAVEDLVMEDGDKGGWEVVKPRRRSRN